MRDEANKMQAAMQAFMEAMHKLDVEYIELMQRMGCKRLMLHRI
jgi:hypothetical protein